MSMLRLSNLDAGLLHGETPEMPMHTMGILLLEKPARAFHERFERTLQARLHLIPPLRRRLVASPLGIGDPHWIEDPDFRLSNHVLRAALPAPGGTRELEAFAGLLAGRLLDRSRPLWEIHLVEGLHDGSIALIVKVHHAVMDGSRLVAALETLLDPSPRVRRMPPPQRAWTPEPEPSLGWKALDASRALVKRPYRLVGSAAEIAGTLLRRRPAATAAERTDAEAPARARAFDAPPTPFNGRLSTLRAIGMGDVALDSVKAIGKHFGTSVNDVVLAASCAALRAWLIAHDALPATPAARHGAGGAACCRRRPGARQPYFDVSGRPAGPASRCARASAGDPRTDCRCQETSQQQPGRCVPPGGGPAAEPVPALDAVADHDDLLGQ
jgi:diacylglycerol O-acyltransferase